METDENEGRVNSLQVQQSASITSAMLWLWEHDSLMHSDDMDSDSGSGAMDRSGSSSRWKSRDTLGILL